MKPRKRRTFVIGISSISGGGKTTVSKKLADLIPDSVTICFDDYDDSIIHPPDLQKWLMEGADYNVWKTPVLTADLESMTKGNQDTPLMDPSIISPAKYIIFDAPLGRAHLESGQFIDFMAFIDTPLDIAMARRLLRDAARFDERHAEELVMNLKTELNSYLTGARPLYLELDKRVKANCDVVLDGCLTVDELASTIRTRIMMIDCG